MSSNSCNSIYLSLTLTASVTSVLLVIVLLTPPKSAFQSPNFSPSSYEFDSTRDSSSDNLLSSASTNALLNDASYLETPDALLKSVDNSPDAAGTVNYNSRTISSSKNTVYTKEDSLPVARTLNIKTSGLTHATANNYPARGKPAKGKMRPSKLQVADEDVSTDAINTSASASEDESSTEEDKRQVICHRAGVVRCGWMLLRAFKFLDFLPPNEVFTNKCAFRNAFFKCLNTQTTGISKCVFTGKINQPERFRTRLARAIWKMRDCNLLVS